MARLFDGGSSQFFSAGGVPVSSNPWFAIIAAKPSALNASVIFGWAVAAETQRFVVVDMNTSGQVRLSARNGAAAPTTTGYTANALSTSAWSIISCGVDASGNAGIRIDSGSIVFTTGMLFPTSPNSMTLAKDPRSASTSYFSGALAEFAVYNGVVEAAHALMVGAGRFSPLFLRRSALVLYHRLIQGVPSTANERPLVGGTIFVNNNGVQETADHPRMRMPSMEPADGMAGITRYADGVDSDSSLNAAGSSLVVQEAGVANASSLAGQEQGATAQDASATEPAEAADARVSIAGAEAGFAPTLDAGSVSNADSSAAGAVSAPVAADASAGGESAANGAVGAFAVVDDASGGEAGASAAVIGASSLTGGQAGEVVVEASTGEAADVVSGQAAESQAAAAAAFGAGATDLAGGGSAAIGLLAAVANVGEAFGGQAGGFAAVLSASGLAADQAGEVVVDADATDGTDVAANQAAESQAGAAVTSGAGAADLVGGDSAAGASRQEPAVAAMSGGSLAAAVAGLADGVLPALLADGDSFGAEQGSVTASGNLAAGSSGAAGAAAAVIGSVASDFVADGSIGFVVAQDPVGMSADADFAGHLRGLGEVALANLVRVYIINGDERAVWLIQPLDRSIPSLGSLIT